MSWVLDEHGSMMAWLMSEMDGLARWDRIQLYVHGRSLGP